MSQSPLEPAQEAADPYTLGWVALNKLIRRGYSWSGHERNCAFLNLGNGGFADVSAVSGFDFPDDGRALATIDWDFDGDTDVLITNRNAPRLRYLENRQRTGNRFVALRLSAGKGNVDGVGATVEVATAAADGAEAGRVVRSVRAGEGYLAQSSAWLTVGLGRRDVEGVVVRWPGGVEETFEDVQTGGFFVLERGTGRAARWEPPAVDAPAGTPASVAQLLEEKRRRETIAAERRLVLAAPLPVPELRLRTTAGQELTLFGIEPGGKPVGTGKPVVLDVWASWCAPCVAQLTEMRKNAERIEASGAAFLALSVDEDPAAAAKLLESIGWSWPWGLAQPETLEILDVLQGALRDSEERLALPTSFLFDRGGALRVVHRGETSADELLADLALLDLPPERMLAAATPLRGTWHRSPLGGDLSLFEARFEARGLPDAARQYARGRLQVVETSRAEMLADFGRRSATQGRLDEAITYLRQALESDPELFRAQFDLAVILHRQGRMVEAIGAYLRALALKPDHEEARFDLGLAYLATGDVEAAKRQVELLREAKSPLADELAEQIK